MTKKIWLVDFPTYQYKEDVKTLAIQNNLKVIDSSFRANIDLKFLVSEAEAPKLTKKAVKKPTEK